MHTLDEIVGENLRRWRHKHERSAEQFAVEAQWWGLSWGPATVAKIERGERPIHLSEFPILCLCLGLSAEKLLNGESSSRVNLTDDFSASLHTVHQALSRGTTRDWRDIRASDVLNSLIDEYETGEVREGIDALIHSIADTPSDAARRDAEVKLARAIGVSPFDLATAAFELWGQGLAEERDARLEEEPDSGRRTRQARRGHVTRQLRRELVAHLGLED